MPREKTFTPERILEAALGILRESGLAGLSARKVAQRLAASVGPVYETFGSMDGLRRAALLRAEAALRERTQRRVTGGAFLDIGVGVVFFAREEPQLFRALFFERHAFAEVLTGFRRFVLERMAADPMLRGLRPAAREELLDRIWTFTAGLAARVISGRGASGSDEEVIGVLRDVGGVLIRDAYLGDRCDDCPAVRETLAALGPGAGPCEEGGDR